MCLPLANINISDIIVIACEQVFGHKINYQEDLKDQYGQMIPTDSTEDLAQCKKHASWGKAVLMKALPLATYMANS